MFVRHQFNNVFVIFIPVLRFGIMQSCQTQHKYNVYVQNSVIIMTTMMNCYTCLEAQTAESTRLVEQSRTSFRKRWTWTAFAVYVYRICAPDCTSTFRNRKLKGQRSTVLADNEINYCCQRWNSERQINKAHRFGNSILICTKRNTSHISRWSIT